jgi:hypothetical protein
MKLKEEIPTTHWGNHRLHRLPVLALLPILLAAGAPHAYPAQAQALKAVRVEKGPSLDPALSDPAWAQAAAFTGFTMVFPNPGEAPTERTELRIVYDATDLYVGVRCFDREPDRIAGNTMLHDGNEEDEGKGNDEVRVLLDPFMSSSSIPGAPEARGWPEGST